MKRICGVLLTLVLLLALVPTAVVTPVAADEREYIVVAGSDFQTSNYSTANVERVLNTLTIHGITKADHAFFVGDYTLNKMETNTSSTGIQALKTLFKPMVGNKMVFVQGNHDHEDTVGLSPAGNNDPVHGGYGAFVIKEDTYREWGNDRQVTQQVAQELRSYLESKHRSGWDRPIFVLCHIPLHWSNRTIKDGSGTDADVLFDILEEYGNKGMNIFYLYGHNHSGGYDDFMGGGAVYLKKGDTMEVCHGVKREHKTRTLSFTYMNAGFIGYYSTTEDSCDAGITMSVFRIKGNEVIVTRYDGNFSMGDGRYGIHNLKSKGIQHPDYSEKGYHAVPDTREYASSRKVTATDDQPVETPMPVNPTEPTTTTTVYTTTTKPSGIAVQKTTATTTVAPTVSIIESTMVDTTTPAESTTVVATTTTTAQTPESTITTTDETSTSTTAATTTASTIGATSTIATQEQVITIGTTTPIESGEEVPAADIAPKENDTDMLTILLIVVGALLLIGASVIVTVGIKKKQK